MGDSCKVFVGNVSYQATDDDLHEKFGQFGKVTDAVIIMDKETRRSRGFGFVTFENSGEAGEAIKSLHDSEFLGRNITVREAENRREGGGGGGGQYRGSGGYGGGRGYGGGGGRGYGGGGGYHDRGGDYRGGGGGRDQGSRW